MFERLRNRFFPQERGAAVLPAREDQRCGATAWGADPAQAPAPEAEQNQTGRAAAFPSEAAGGGPRESAATVAQPPERPQAADQAADPSLPAEQAAVDPALQRLPHRPGQAARRSAGLDGDAVITIDNRRYQLANLPEDVRQLVAGLQAADRVIAHRRSLRRLLLASRQLVLAQLQQGLQAQASLPSEPN